MTKSREVGIGVVCMVLSMACLTVHDSTNKYLIASVPPLMVMWFRYTFQALLTTSVLWPTRGRAILHTRHLKLQFLRGMLLVVCGVLAFMSLQRMPVAEFTAMGMLLPLVLTFIARFVMGEPVSAPRWALVAGGLAGAMLIVRPGGAVDPSMAWMPLTMVLLYAVFQTLTGHMARSEHPMTMNFYTGWICSAASTLLVLLMGVWTTDLKPGLWPFMVLIGLAGTLGQYFMILAFSKAPASTVSPFLYCGLGFATLAGWLVFAQVPDAWATTGMLLIAACGLGAGWLSAREHRAPA